MQQTEPSKKEVYFMKIMLIANDTNFAYNLRRELMIDWIEQGNEVILVAHAENYLSELEAYGIKVENVKIKHRGKNPASDIILMLRYNRIIRRIGPDIVFINNTKPNICAGMVCRLNKVKYIPNITGLGTAVENNGLLSKLTAGMYKCGVMGAKTILFQNTYNLKFFSDRKMIPEGAESVLLPGSGVNLQAHPLLEYPNEDNGIHFLFISRILKEKGIDQYLYVAKKIRSERSDVFFHIVGGCESRRYKKILSKLHDDGVIIYHGFRKDVTPFFEKASCLVYPSYYPEGVSNVLLEAAASGRPVITTDRIGCREAVDDGVTGYIVPIRDKEATLDAVVKILGLSREKRIKMGLAGREKMEMQFDRNIVIRMVNDAWLSTSKSTHFQE